MADYDKMEKKTVINSQPVGLRLLRLVHVIYAILLLLYLGFKRVVSQEDLLGTSFYLVLVGIFILCAYLMSYIKGLKKLYSENINRFLWLSSMVIAIEILRHPVETKDIIIILLLMMLLYQVITETRLIVIVAITNLLVMTVVLLLKESLEYSSFLVLISYLFLTAIIYVKQKSYNQAIAQKDEELFHRQSILNNASEGFAVHRILFDQNNRPYDYVFLGVNKAFEEITGLKASEVVGKSVLQVLPLTESYWIELYGAVVTENKNIKTTNYSTSFKKYFEVSAYPTGNNGFATLFLDITDRMVHNNQMKLALKKVEKANVSKSQFLRDVNHRLRTPLNGIMGMMQLIDYQDLSVDNRELFNTMLQEAKNSRNIIDQLSNYVNLQDYNYEISCRKIEDDITELIQQFDGKAQERIQVSDNLSFKEVIFYESEVFKKILFKLISNALKYSDNHLVEISINFNEETKDEEGTNYYISVKDKGIGIDLDLQFIIFNEFYHHDFINIYREEDHISLALCRQMAINIGGEIIVESFKGRGSKFTLVLPVTKIEKTD